MTISSATAKITGAGDDSAFTFSFSPLVLYASTDIEVTHVAANGDETLLTEGSGSSNYSVTVTLYPGTGSVTYPADEGTPMATGESIVMKLVLTLEQQTDLENQGGYNPASMERQLDKLLQICIQQQEEIDRCIKFSVGDDATSTEVIIPKSSERVSKKLAFDSSGDLTVTA